MAGGSGEPVASDPLAISCPRCNATSGEPCPREGRYAGLPHFQRVEAAGGDTAASSLEENRRFRESRGVRRR
ncbi:zinc finger domain-containing protein [Sphingomonas kaistensis]|uniref:zinc finger domain-containing protein n=1 Tax=Sphingomonas kaistensis TaxID=298708 RepID=UPI003CC91004